MTEADASAATTSSRSGTPAVRVRQARLEDIEIILDIVDRAYRAYITRIGRRPAPMDADVAEQVRGDQVFVAERSTVVGVIVLCAQPQHLLIENVAVDPEAQRDGVGRALLAHAEAHAIRARLPEVRLYTNAAMRESLAFYARLGYVEAGRRISEGYDRVFLSKPLHLRQ